MTDDVAGGVGGSRVWSRTVEADGVDRWRETVSGSLLRFEVDCLRPDEFHGSITRRSLGHVGLVAMASHPHLAVRADEHIGTVDRPEYLLSLQLAGRAEFTQDGRRARVRPGDLVFYDSTRPVEIVSGEGYRSLCFQFPRATGPGGRPGSHQLTATAMDGGHGLAPAVAGVLTGLYESLAAPSSGSALGQAVRHATGLAEALFADELARRGVAPADPHRELRERVDRHIEARLPDPGLSPGTIAAEQFVSVRHLHAVFAEDGRSVAATIRDRRLERCLVDLADPAWSHLSVSAVAARWGMLNPTRFGQLVKERTGLTPVAYRRRLGPG